MHESVIANTIIKEAKKQGDVKGITIEVGELAPLTADELRKAMSSMIRWEVTCYTKKAKVRCRCGYEGEAKIKDRGHDYVLFACPECGRVPEIKEGKDIITKEVVVE